MLQDSSGSDNEYKNQVRKRSNPEEWKRNIMKKKKVKGECHTSYSGKVIEKRQTGGQCKCPRKCFDKVDRAELQFLISCVNKFDNKNSQDTYLQSLIEIVPVKRPKKVCYIENSGSSDNETDDCNAPVSNKKTKHRSVNYHVKLSSGRVLTVCQKAFVSMYGIFRGRVERLRNLLVQGEIPLDKRGKARSANAISGDICQKIHEFIDSIPKKATHYTNKPKFYLSSELNLKILLEMFNKKYSLGLKYDFFRRYYKENFNFSFGRPQVDVCITCESLSNKIKDSTLCDSSKRAAVAEKLVHARRAKKFYDKLKDLTQNLMTSTEFKEKNFVMCFDYMQNIQLPHIPVQDIFYYRQLSVSTFCIHNVASRQSTLYVYHEGIAKKTPNEVITFFLNYISTNVPDSVQHLHIFSDGCAAQNRNHTLVRLLLNLTDNNRFHKISHYYPQRGHSFIPCDRDFSLIKRCLNKSDRLYNIEQLGELMIRSAYEGKFCVKYVQTEEIKNFSDWWPKYYKKTCLSDDSYGRNIEKKVKLQFHISKFSHFEYSSSHPGKIRALQFIDSATSSFFSLRKILNPLVLNQNVPPLYQGKVPIFYKKVTDLKKILVYIPEAFKNFYEEVTSNWPTSAAQENDEEIS